MLHHSNKCGHGDRVVKKREEEGHDKRMSPLITSLL